MTLNEPFDLFTFHKQMFTSSVKKPEKQRGSNKRATTIAAALFRDLVIFPFLDHRPTGFN